ncbi:MAG: ATP-binding protein [Calditrichia bacterium]
MQNKQTEKQIDPDKLVISSNLAELPRVEKFSQKIARKAALNEDQSDNIAIAITELVNNAIKHGNQNDPTKSVTILAEYRGDRVSITIKDQGSSFDPNSLQNPTEPENLWKENGRGIFIVKNLVDEVIFNPTDQGMEITIVEYLKSGRRNQI